MFKRLLSFVFAAVLFGLSAPGASAQSQAQPGERLVTPIIVVLDVGLIRREASSVKSIREQIVKFQNELQEEIQKEQEALRTAQTELAKKQTLLAPEAFAEERRKFEKRVVGVQQLVQTRRRALEDSQNAAMVKVEETLNGIVIEFARTRGYAMVVRRAQVVLVDDALNITRDVLSELNARMPTVKVEAPKK